MKLHPEPFAKMASGTKKSELRLNDEKRRQLNIGDTIIFTNRGNELETLTVTITYLHAYPTFEEMYRAIRNDYPTWEEGPFIEAMYKYYSPEEVSRWGALEIGVHLI